MSELAITETRNGRSMILSNLHILKAFRYD